MTALLLLYYDHFTNYNVTIHYFWGVYTLPLNFKVGGAPTSATYALLHSNNHLGILLNLLGLFNRFDLACTILVR